MAAVPTFELVVISGLRAGGGLLVRLRCRDGCSRSGAGARAGSLRSRLRREWDVEFVSLAAVADVDAAVEVGTSLPGFVAEIFGARLVRKAANSGSASASGSFAADTPEDGAGIVFHDVAGQNSEGGERAGQRGDDHPRDAQGFGEFAGVEASGAAEGDQREIAGVVAALDGDDADGFLHGGVDDADDSGGELFQA